MSAEAWLIVALAAPVAQAAFVMSLARPPGLRDVVHIGFALLMAAASIALVSAVSAGEGARVALVEPLPGVALAFTIEPLSALIGCAVACLGALSAIHTAGYVRATEERAPARLMATIALSTAAAMAAIYSANLLTLFVCTQALMLATFPLVAHGGGAEARRAASTHLATLLIASMGLLLPAIVWAYVSASAVDFQVGGVLAGRLDPLGANILLAMFVLGLAMAATPPLHRWLIASSAAPFPALMTIQALAVVPVGGIGVLKVTLYVFGDALPDAAIAARVLLVIAGVGMCYAAVIALSKQDIRERLAYAAMAQSLAVVMGALVALPAGAFAAALQIAALACGSATMLMAAGAAYAVTDRLEARDLHGLGRVMPWTMAGFALGAASIIGMPPFAGAWAKLWLITAAADAGLPWAAALVGLASVLMFASLGPLAANTLVGPAPHDPFKRRDGASALLTGPIVLSAAATLWLLILANPIAWFLAPILGRTP